jgi:hypothetical protein
VIAALRHGTSAAKNQVPSTSITEPNIACQRDFIDKTCSDTAHFLARSQNVLTVQIGSRI